MRWRHLHRVGDLTAVSRPFPGEVAGLKSEVGLNHNAPERRSYISRIFSAWDSAVLRGVKRRTEDADQRVGDLPRKLPKQTHLNMVDAYNQNHRELKEAEIPHSACVENGQTQCETGKLIAERLNQVAGEDEAKGDNLGTARIKSTGEILWKKSARIYVPPFSDIESMRFRNKTMARLWAMVKLHLPAQAQLEGSEEQDWADHLDFVLGEDVYNAEITTADGMKDRTTWLQVLTVKYQLRKHAFHLVHTKAMTIAEALKKARGDAELFRKYFSTPASMTAGAEAAKEAVAAATAASSRDRPRACQALGCHRCSVLRVTRSRLQVVAHRGARAVGVEQAVALAVAQVEAQAAVQAVAVAAAVARLVAQRLLVGVPLSRRASRQRSATQP